jgi:bifunctional N-acetylglucosamine-1-phosphate-uridyltransferase/glucosamine-1-phosphate-acetyltransferase GlmU-like protein
MINHPPTFLVLWDHESKEDIMINAGKTIISRIWVTESTKISPQTIMINSPLSIMIKRNKDIMTNFTKKQQSYSD